MTQKLEVTEEEREEYETVFRLFDRNGSGTISAEELVQAMQNLGIEPNPLEIECLIKKVDLDQGGTVNLDEFIYIMALQMQDLRDNEQCLRAFRIFDRDRNGFITKSEIKWVMNKMGDPVSEQEAEEMIREADVNGDGLIDYKEFFQQMMK